MADRSHLEVSQSTTDGSTGCRVIFRCCIAILFLLWTAAKTAE
jgi:hypothetical protein